MRTLARLPLLLSLLHLLSTVLPAQRELLDTLPPDAEAYALRLVGFGREFTPLELPGEGTPHGLARIGDVVWMASDEELLRLKWPGGAVELRVEAPKGVLGLCADARFVYALCANEIVVLDPIAGRAVRSLPLQLGEPPVAIAWRSGALHVLTGERLTTVNAQSGAVAGLRGSLMGHSTLREDACWLASDGERLWCGYPNGVYAVPEPSAPTTGWQGRKWPWQLEASTATWVDGQLLLAGSYRNALGESVTVTGLLKPEPEYAECLPLKLRLQRGKTTYEVGPKPVSTRCDLRQELTRIAADPACRVPGPDGKPRHLPVVLDPYPGVTVAALAAAWDTVLAAGFTDVSSPAQEAWALAERRRKK
ncbi:MAG TPA: hypothetical protein VFZ65_06290 [Planctomycetota bacterium]|nr:hypothetical protein [Planctomycetota bacterium]